MTTLVENKKAHFDYQILESYEAGIELLGFEVKSLRKHQGNLLGAYVTIRGGEAFIIGMNIPAYQEKNTPETYDPLRNRKILLAKKEILELANPRNGKGLTIIPLSLYNKGRKIKVEIAVVRGKKTYDKRESIKKRQSERDIARGLRD